MMDTHVLPRAGHVENADQVIRLPILYPNASVVLYFYLSPRRDWN